MFGLFKRKPKADPILCPKCGHDVLKHNEFRCQVTRPNKWIQYPDGFWRYEGEGLCGCTLTAIEALYNAEKQSKKDDE